MKYLEFVIVFGLPAFCFLLSVFYFALTFLKCLSSHGALNYLKYIIIGKNIIIAGNILLSQSSHNFNQSSMFP